MNDLEKKIQADLDKELHLLDTPGVAKVAPMPRMPKAAQLSVAEQLLGVAESIKDVHREIDTIQKEFIARLDELRRRLGSRG